MGTPFTPDRLASIRRLRKARRLYKKMPLFAYQQMLLDYPDYSPAEFWDDLRLRSKPRKKHKKSDAVRYGRYYRIQSLLKAFRESGDINLMIQATKLNQRLRQPYKVIVKLNRDRFEFSFSPHLPIEKVESLTGKFTACKTLEEIETVYRDFKNTIPIF